MSRGRRVLAQNEQFLVELDESGSQAHGSRGTYRVLLAKVRQAGPVIFETQNRDKALGVFEYVTEEQGMGGH
jgi:hypothetical protein